MVIKRARLPVEVPSGAEMRLWDALHRDFPGLIFDVKSKYWDVLQLPFSESNQNIPGEIYLSANGVMLYYVVDASRQFIEAGCLMSQSESSQAFRGFCERIKQAISPGRGDRDPLWYTHNDIHPSFELIREESQPLRPTPAQLEAATALTDAERRQLLRRIHGQRSCLLESLAVNGKSLMDIGTQIQQLDNLGLVHKDFVVFCHQEGNQISRVSNFAQIEEATKHGFKCFSCGRPIAEERIDQLLTCTGEGLLLARQNYWLSVILASTLERIGVASEHQLMLPFNERTRVLDVFANYDGLLMMFEVKEDRVQLDDAYLFYSRIEYYRPNVAFYITTQPMRAEVKNYLRGRERTGPTRITILETPEELEGVLRTGIAQAQRKRFRDLIGNLEPSTRVDVSALIYQFFFARPKAAWSRPADKTAPPEKTVSPTSEKWAAHTDKPAKAESGEPARRPLQPRVSAGSPHASHLRAEPGRLSVEGADEARAVPPGRSEDAERSLDEVFQPIMDMQEILDIDEMPGSERSADEVREQVIRRVCEDIAARGVLGRGEQLEALLSDLNELPNITSALIADNGLLLTNALDERLPAEMVAAVTAEITDQIQRGLETVGAPPATRIVIESVADRLYVRPTGYRVLLIVREERPPHTQEEEPVLSLPGEMILREAMMKKVLDELSMVEGLRSAIVTGRDGLVIDAFIDGDQRMTADFLSAILSLFVTENEKACSRLQLYPLRQMTVRTEQTLYSMMPLDKEGILITLIDPATPREVWQSRLFSAANMLTSVFQ